MSQQCFATPLIMLTVLAGGAGCSTSPPNTPQPAETSAREDIFVLRSLRLERSAKSAWCTAERTGFTPVAGGFLLEDRYSMWAVTVHPDTGRVASAKSREVGELRACFAQAAEPRVVHFHAEGRIAGLQLIGDGQCTIVRPDFPENGISGARCHLEIRGLPAPYVGGMLTTNSVNSRQAIGDVSDPPGYVQPSIATIRLWRMQTVGETRRSP